MRQAVLWVPFGPKPGRPDGHHPVALGERPSRLWTLLMPEYNNPEKVPPLPITPRHQYNAFIEDSIHDWDHRKGMLYYFSRVTDRGTWVLLEYEK